MKKTGAKRTGKARAEARAKARRAVLSSASEEMVAFLRLHVAGCPQCELRICGQGMREFLGRVDRRLAAARTHADARTGVPRPSRGRRARGGR